MPTTDRNARANTTSVHPEACRILRRYRTMSAREIRRAGPDWIRVEHDHNAHCYACGCPDVAATIYEATRGPQPNTVLEDGICLSCGHRYEWHVADVPNTGCDPRTWTPERDA